MHFWLPVTNKKCSQDTSVAGSDRNYPNASIGKPVSTTYELMGYTSLEGVLTVFASLGEGL